ncbi:MAG TPA: carboxypeptidase-like regulatory domain-containing protein [Pyrinomonadaceae bacterium]|nr:carboxypeptidase-like regulatory domain-containing protein [Pyrinomonadaceae bacterium]
MRFQTTGGKLFGAALLCGWLLASALAASAQEATATLKGATTGADGAAVAGVKLTLVQQETRLNPRTAHTGEAGEYSFTSLPAGVYKVTVEAAGFKTIVAANIEILTGDTQELKFTLEPGSPEEVINIESAPPAPPTP